MKCADCSCEVERGVRVVVCAGPAACCCTGAPTASDARPAPPAPA